MLRANMLITNKFLKKHRIDWAQIYNKTEGISKKADWRGIYSLIFFMNKCTYSWANDFENVVEYSLIYYEILVA